MPLIRNRRKFENNLLKLTAALLLLSFVYLGGTFLLGRNLKGILVNALNDELKVKVKVKRIDLDVLSNFPLIAIRFNDLCIEESTPYFNDCMLNAPELRMIFNTGKLRLSIRLSDEDYQLKLAGNCFFDHLMYKDEMILFGKRVETDGLFRMTSERDQFSFQDFMLKVEELPVKINGGIAMKTEGTDFDLKLDGADLQIDQLISLMPEAVKRELPALRSNGSLSIDGQMRGLLNEHQYPFMQVQFALEDGALFNGDIPTGFENIQLRGNWEQAEGQP
jgi:hypothetical protein